MALPGDIRYIEKTGADGKKILVKQKYYKVIQNFGSSEYLRSYWFSLTGTVVDYTYYGGDEPILDYRLDDQILNAFFNVIDFKKYIEYYPDDKINLYGTSIITELNFNSYKGNIPQIPLQSKRQLIQPCYTFVQGNTNIQGAGGAGFYTPLNRYYDVTGSGTPGSPYTIQGYNSIIGYNITQGWAEQSGKPNQNKTDANPTAPEALDKDWTPEEVIEKQKDLQIWVDNNLLPPIFGPTNSVYFPSNLGDTNSFTGEDRNPIITGYPIPAGQLAEDKLSEQYDLVYPISKDYLLITGKKDEVYSINCVLPITKKQSCRFEVFQDNVESIQNESVGDSLPYTEYRSTLPDGCELVDKTFKPGFKVNQIVSLRFIEQQDAEDTSLLNEQKFNQYTMIGIITQVNIHESAPNSFIASNITIKLLNDNGLTKDKYFNAKVVVLTQAPSNYIQNKTYCIKRYYKKDLGIGPRLGGSIMIASNNETEGDNTNNGIYKYTGVLKDEEKLNKPYLNVNFNSIFTLYTDNWSDSEDKLVFTHSFSQSDLSGKFEFISGNKSAGLDTCLSKQFIPKFNSYLIKNLDEHDYEFYVKMRPRIYRTRLFYESTDNVNLIFGSYS